MKYFLTNTDRTAPATLNDAKYVSAVFKKRNMPARVCVVGGGYGIETDDPKIAQLTAGATNTIPLKYEHIEGFIPRRFSLETADLIWWWGGKVDCLSEEFDDTYIEADVLDDGVVNVLIKNQLL